MKASSKHSLTAKTSVRATLGKRDEIVFCVGDRLAALRKAAGFTQTDLARELGVSRRMIAYYEGETKYPPSAILPRLAQALGVTADELLNGAKVLPSRHKPKDVHIQRTLQQLERLSSKERRKAMRLLDSFIESQSPRGKYESPLSKNNQ